MRLPKKKLRFRRRLLRVGLALACVLLAYRLWFSQPAPPADTVEQSKPDGVLEALEAATQQQQQQQQPLGTRGMVPAARLGSLNPPERSPEVSLPTLPTSSSSSAQWTETDDEASYLSELDTLVESGKLFPKAQLSLKLMGRRGHRRRLMDLIGSTAPNATLSSQRYALANLVSRFAEDGLVDPRDYAQNPVRIRTRVVIKCSLPCTPCSQPTTLVIGRIDQPFEFRPKGDCDTSEERLTMENYPCNLVFNTHEIKKPSLDAPIIGSTRLESDVTLLYFSWYDFGIMETPPTFAQKKELAASFISNCKSEVRNEVLRNLIAYSGGRIKSYGKCQKTDEEVHTPSGEKYANKLATLRKYKFTLAFENSQAKDYLSEKFWQALLVGSVPIVIGAPNSKFYAPDTGPYPYQSNAILTLEDFNFDGRALTEYLVKLDTDEAAYQKHMRWKTTGYSDDFKALGDMTSAHSACRVCVVAADRRRWVLGPNVYDRRTVKQVLVGDAMGAGGFGVYIRERGQYSFTLFRFTHRPSMALLVEQVLGNVQPSEKPLYFRNDDLRGMPVRVYGFYILSPRVAVLTDKDLEALPHFGAELEVGFTFHADRPNVTSFFTKKNRILQVIFV